MKHFFWTVFFLSFWATAVLAQEGQTPLLEVSFDNTSRVTSASFSPDAKTVLCGYEDGTAKLWDFKGTVLQTFTGHTKGLTSVAFSPDGKTIWTSSGDRTAKLWNLDGRELQIFSEIPRKIYGYGVAFSPDGKTLLFAGGNVQLWDLNGRELQNFKFKSALGRVTAMAFSPDGNTVLCGGDRSNAILFDLNGKEIRTFWCPPGDQKVFSVAFSPDGKYILTNNTLWGLDGQQISTFPYGSDNATFSPDGKYILIFKTLFDLKGQKLQTFGVHIPEVSVTSGAFSPDGKTVLTGKYNRKTGKFWIQQWPVLQPAPPTEVATPDKKTPPTPPTPQKPPAEVVTREQKVTPAPPTKQTPPAEVATREQQASPAQPTKQTPSLKAAAATPAPPGDQTPRLVIPIGNATDVKTVAFSPDGKYILTNNTLWDSKGRELQRYEGVLAQQAFSQDGKSVLAYNAPMQAVQLLDLASGRVLKSITGHAGDVVRGLALSPDGQKFLVRGARDFSVKLWDISTGRELKRFTGHTSFVQTVAFSPDGKLVVTTSEDKTAKIWDSSTGALKQTINTGEAGRGLGFFFAAISPDNKYLFTDNPKENKSYVVKQWDISTGLEVKQLSGHTAPVACVAFSPDSKYILTGSWDKTAKLWDLASGALKQTFTGHTDRVQSAAFSPDSKYILTGSIDKTAKLWDLEGHALHTLSGQVAEVRSFAISPDKKTLLTGDLEGSVKQWGLSERSLKPFTAHKDWVTSLAFSPDGQTVATSSADGTAKLCELSGNTFQTYTGHTKIVSSIAFSPTGDTLLSGSWDKTAQLWDRSGRTIQTLTGHTSYVKSVAFSPDGKRLLTGGSDFFIRLWDVSGGRLDNIPVKYEPAVAFSPNGQQFLTSHDIDLAAKLWKLSTGEEIRAFAGHKGYIMSVAFSPDGKMGLTAGGSDKTAKLWNVSTGGEIKTFSETTGVLQAAFSRQGKYILTLTEDKKVNIWNLETGEKLVSLLSFNSNNDWVVLSPSGLFDASPGAMNQMHYMVGLEVVELDQLKERYYEPGLLAKALGFIEGETRDVSALTELPLYPDIHAEIAGNQLKINLTARSGGMGKLSFFINGKEVAENLSPDGKANVTVDLKAYDKNYLPGTNTLSLRAYNSDNWLKSPSYELPYPPLATGKGGNDNEPQQYLQSLSTAKPHLYAIVIGTSNYSGEELDLHFPDLDAKAVAQALSGAGKVLFADRVHLRLLTTDGKTPADISSKKNIAAAFTEYAAQAKPSDILIVYFSGHGITYGGAEKSQFYYLTKDIASSDLKDTDVRNNYTVSSDDLTKWLTDITAQKQVMILDACNSGKVVEAFSSIGARSLNASQIRALERMKDRTGMFILTGAAADQKSYEASQYGQGLLTYSLLQGMSGLALTSDRRVDVMTLFQYARDQVPELATSVRKVQIPVLAFPNGGASFDIGIVDAGVKIPLAQVKPVFIRNNFQDEDTFDDELGLTKALANYLEEIKGKGAQAEIIYVDVSEYENAYSIKGRYSVSGDAVTIRGRLFKGKTPVGKEFVVPGKKDDLEALVEAIVEAVSELL